MRTVIITVALLIASNVFMTFAGYAHLRNKIIQEVVTLGVFVPFALFYMHQPLKLNFLWAGLCLVGAVFFMFR